MDPQDFLKIANALVNSPEQSGLRTSVSRSYYAVVLFFRNYFANKLGFQSEDRRLGAAVHIFVPECFTQCDIIEVKKIGERINRLKLERTKADYLLSKPVSPDKAGDCLEEAKKLINYSISNGTEIAVLAQATTRAKARQLI